MFRQVSSYMIANVVSAIFGFASVVIFTRFLAPEEYGIYIVGLSIAAMISALIFGWIKVSVVSFTADDTGTDIRVTAGLAFLALTLLIPALYFGVAAFWPDTVGYLVPAIMLAFGIGAFEFYLEMFRAQQKTRPYMWATIIRAAAALGLALFFVLVLKMGGLGLLASIALSYFITTILYSRLVWRSPRKPLDGELLQKMLSFGLPMTISGTIFVLQTMLDRLALANILGEHAAGIYGASADLVRQIILFPGVAIGSAVAPMAIRLMGQGDRHAVDRHMVDGTELLLAVLAPAVVGLAIIAPKLAYLVLGEEFRFEASYLVPIIATAWLFRSMSYQLVHVSFQLTKSPGLMMGQGAIILAINAACLFVLVPTMGLLGAAISMLISETLGVAIGYLLSHRAYPLPLDPSPFTKVALATLSMAIPTYLIDRNLGGHSILELGLPVVGGMALYAVACFTFDVAGIRGRFRARTVTAPAE